MIQINRVDGDTIFCKKNSLILNMSIKDNSALVYLKLIDSPPVDRWSEKYDYRSGIDIKCD